MYNINQNVEVREFSGASAIPVGINEGCKLAELTHQQIRMVICTFNLSLKMEMAIN